MANINSLADEINQALKVYGTFVNGEVEEIAEEVTKDAAKELQTAGSFNDRTGSYRKGWESIKDGKNWVVRNKTDAQLTHLLEKGHAKKNGGRTKKFVHIKPVEQKTISEFEKKIRERL